MDLGSQVLAVDPIHILEDVTVPRRDSDLTAWVNVIFGCNERCTYCVVPNTRGREQSRDPAAIKVVVLPRRDQQQEDATLLNSCHASWQTEKPSLIKEGRFGFIRFVYNHT